MAIIKVTQFRPIPGNRLFLISGQPMLQRSALGGDGLRLVLDNSRRQGKTARLHDLPPMGVGTGTVIANDDLQLLQKRENRVPRVGLEPTRSLRPEGF